MSDDLHTEDRVLGTALSRAIETQPVREMPFERSRLAARLERRPAPRWGLRAAVATAGVIALAIVFSRPGGEDVAAPPVVTFGPTPTAAATATPSAALTEPTRVYLARDGVPPLGAIVDGPAPRQPTAEERIRARLTALIELSRVPVVGAINAVDPARLRSVTDVQVDGDLTTVDLAVTAGDWGVRGAAQIQALLQQLVYTATEEPGIRRLRLTANGGTTPTIDQFVVDAPLSREDVFGYEKGGNLQTVRGFGDRDGLPRALASSFSVDAVAPGLARFLIRFSPGATPDSTYPDWEVSVERSDGAQGGKWKLVVQVVNATDPKTGVERVDRTPLRAITTRQAGAATVYELELDDLRPWRTALEPDRIIVDVGGHPGAVSDRNAVYLPRPGDAVGRTIQVGGIAAAFEAHVGFRVRDAEDRVVAGAFALATNCCEPGGTFGGSIQVPADVPAGPITLEVFQPSARDGSDLALIAIPLTLR